jgi:hypothetical protein
MSQQQNNQQKQQSQQQQQLDINKISNSAYQSNGSQLLNQISPHNKNTQGKPLY